MSINFTKNTVSICRIREIRGKSFLLTRIIRGEIRKNP